MKIVIAGAGAIGGYIGAKLAKAGADVTLFARGPHLQAMLDRGLRVEGEEPFDVRPQATGSLESIGKADVVFLGVKAHSLTDLAPRLAPLFHDDTVVVSTQNGIPWWYFQQHGGELDGLTLEHVDPGGVIARSIEARRVIGSIAYFATEIERPGVIRHIEGNRISFGEPDGTKSERCTRIAQALIAAGLRCPVSTRFRQEIWVKLLGNIAFNPISALTGGTLVRMATHPETSKLVREIMKETEAVAQRLGIELPISIDQRIAGAAKVGEHKTHRGVLPLMADQIATSAHPLESLIDQAFERRMDITPANVDRDLYRAVSTILHELNTGKIRVAEKRDGAWVTNQWVKKAVLLYFRAHDNKVMQVEGRDGWFDKVPVRFLTWSDAQFRESGFRVVPPATVRSGAFIGRNVVLMPSYVNIGAYVDEGTMVDTWATVGSCAQIGKHVHLSGGVGIGGVLEPLQANPTIIEDNCFIGARSEIVEGVVVEANSVISMGVFIGQSTKIYDRSTGEIIYGRVPAGSVVVPGSLPSADGKYSLACAVIVKRVDADTRAKTSINELLRQA